MSDNPKWILPDMAPRPLVIDAPEPSPSFVPVRCVITDEDGSEVGEFEAVIDPAKWIMHTAKVTL